jgi:hypothetical protein
MPMGRVLRRVATLLMLTLRWVMEEGGYHLGAFERSSDVGEAAGHGSNVRNFLFWAKMRRGEALLSDF